MERCSCSLQPRVVSLLISIVSTLLFFRTGGEMSHLNSSTHGFALRTLCSLIFAATDSLFSLGLAKSRILLAALADIRPRAPLISCCTVQLRTLRRSLFGDSLSLYDLWFRLWGVSRILGLYGLPSCPHPSQVVG